ncbi:MAG: hypothetical protein COV45_02250 [Deltaproteobacteria bacterium CG11_big_fil_rev_8_21_14_0_20_47_16]|nr:MAG: hypothetical protein COV45_02250 [Deltaproteobacteria bacterium CG11_big_fil_rev_8_21_14_0_20_47_16]
MGFVFSFKHCVVILLLVGVVACSGGSKSESVSGSGLDVTSVEGPSEPASAEAKPTAIGDSTSTGNATTTGVTIVETPAPLLPPDVPKPVGVPKPDPMVASITAPVAGSLFALMPDPYTNPIILAGSSNKEDATYKWDVLDPNSAAVDLKTNPDTQKLFFIPKLPGDYTITLSGSAPDGTSNSVSVKVTVEKPPSEATFLKITGMNDGASYPLDGSYPLLAMNYSDQTNMQYFSFKWDVVKKPETSKADIASTIHSATFQADVEGNYTIQVTAVNAVGEKTQKSIAVSMLPSRVVELWGGFFGNIPPKMVLSSGYQEIYFGSEYGVLKYGKGKQWLPIINNSAGTAPIVSAARVSETEVYFGSKGKVIQYDGANYATIKLPAPYANAFVTNVSATAGDVWAIADAVLFHVVKGKAEVVNVNGKALNANHVISYGPNNVIAFFAAYTPVMQYQGEALGWKAIPSKYQVWDVDHLVIMVKCGHVAAIDPVVCLSDENTIYTIEYDANKGFGPLTYSNTLNPVPSDTFVDIAASPQNGLLLLNKSGQFYAFNPNTNSWGKSNLQSPPLDPNYGVVGTVQANAPFLIAGAGELFQLDMTGNNMIWKKEPLPSGSFHMYDVHALSDGTIAVSGEMDQKAAFIIMDSVTKQILNYYASDIDGPLYGVVGSGVGNLYGSVNGGLAHFDGKAFSKPTPSNANLLFNNSGPTPIAASPDGKKIYGATTYKTSHAFFETSDGVNYTIMSADLEPSDVDKIIVADVNNIYALGKTNTKYFVMWKLDEASSTWKKVGDHYFFYRDAYAVSPNDITVVGKSGTIMHFDGVQWQDETSGVTEDVMAVSGTNGQVWALTIGGKLLKRDANTASWSVVTNLPKNQVAGLSELFFIDPQNYIYGGALDFNFVGVMSN